MSPMSQIVLFLGVLLSILCGVTYGCPRIISRKEWGARRVNCLKAMSTPVPFVIIHHSEGAPCTNKAACIRVVKGIQDYHINGRKWCDIGYSFLVGEDGNIYEGRGWNKVGAHAPDYNQRSIGISVLGSFTNKVPNEAATNAVKSLISCGVSKGFIQSSYTLKGHRDVFATSCPGNVFYKLIRTWPRYKA